MLAEEAAVDSEAAMLVVAAVDSEAAMAEAPVEVDMAVVVVEVEV